MSVEGTGERAGEETSTGRAGTAAQISLVDLLDRLLGTGVVLAGDVVISLAGVDLVEVKLLAVISSVRGDADQRVVTSLDG